MEANNPFKKIIEPLKEVPTHIHKDVMSDVHAINLAAELASLFTSNFAEAAESLLEKRKQQRKDQKDNYTK